MHVHDTLHIHDTSIVRVHDTLRIYDSVFVYKDTLHLHDTLKVHDTIFVYKDTLRTHDTIRVHDTLNIRDTLRLHDTTKVYDTLHVKNDTLRIHDTTTVLDTVRVFATNTISDSLIGSWRGKSNTTHITLTFTPESNQFLGKYQFTGEIGGLPRSGYVTGVTGNILAINLDDTGPTSTANWLFSISNNSLTLQNVGGTKVFPNDQAFILYRLQ
jgi:hypothetical protein